MKNLEILKSINNKYNSYNNNILPLCAAENIMSDFSMLPLSSSIQEKYIMGGSITLQKDHNFMESPLLFEYYELLTKICNELYGSNYADARTLTGMNALTTLLMSVFEIGDKILISSEDSGGHGSIPLICKRLGIEFEYLPYNYTNFDFDYETINQKLESSQFKGIVIGLSDVQYHPNLEKINLKDIILIYDATQTLGIIAHNKSLNPLLIFSEDSKVILLGATHKTIPGPSCGLILARNIKFAETIDKKINPTYIRNVQMHQILSLIYTLIEFQEFGQNYIQKMLENTCLLSNLLSSEFKLIRKENMTSQTHQIHLYISPEDLDNFYSNATFYQITLNKRTKKLYKFSGIRIGTQEITRLGYSMEDLEDVSLLLGLLKKKETITLRNKILSVLDKLHKNRELKYCFNRNDKEISEFPNLT